MLHVGTCLYYFEIVCLYRATVCEGPEGSWCIWPMLKHSGYSGDQREVRIWRSIPRFVGYIYNICNVGHCIRRFRRCLLAYVSLISTGACTIKNLQMAKWPTCHQRWCCEGMPESEMTWHDSHFSSLNGYMVDQQTPPRLQNVENACFWMLLDAKFKCT